MSKFASAALALAFFGSIASAQPAPKPDGEKKLVTKVYDVKPLIGERGRAVGLANADAVVKVIFQSISFGESNAVPQVIERDGGKLEIHAPEAAHGEIRDLLDALERLQDLAIDLKAEVYELDAEGFQKLVKALPKPKGQPGSPVLYCADKEDGEGPERTVAGQKALGEADEILKAGRAVQTSTGRYVNGADATVSSRHSVLRFTGNGNPAWVPTDDPQFVKDGFALVARPDASADRRFIRLKVTEQSTRVTGMRKRELGVIGNQRLVAESPVAEDLGATGSAVVADGGTLIFRLAYAPKDRVWVVVLKPTIFIPSEEDERNRPEKK